MMVSTRSRVGGKRRDSLAAVATILVAVCSVVLVPLASLNLGSSFRLRDRGRQGQRQNVEEESGGLHGDVIGSWLMIVSRYLAA